MTLQADEDLSLVEQVRHDLNLVLFMTVHANQLPTCFVPLQNMIESRLATLSDRITLCNRVLGDLRDLSVVLEVRPVFSPPNFVIY